MEQWDITFRTTAGGLTTFLVGFGFSVKDDVSPTSPTTEGRSRSAENYSHCHNIGRAPLLCLLITSTPRLYYVTHMPALVIDLGIVTHAVFEDEDSSIRIRKPYTRRGMMSQGIPSLFHPLEGIKRGAMRLL